MADSSTDLPKRLPLITDPSNRDGTFTKDARLVNCYVETRKTAEGNEYWIYSRPGRSLQSSPPGATATGRGVFRWKGDLYSIFGNKLYKNGVAIAGTVDTTNGLYRFESNQGATPMLQLGNGVAAYNYDDGSGLVQITDADFPSAFCKGWAYLDATTYVLLPNGHIQGSELNDTTSWDPLNDIFAQIESDDGVALSKQLVYVVAFKQWSTEIFYDAQNAAGSPLGPVQGAKISFGCLSADSVQEIDGGLYWLVSSKTSGVQVGKLESLKFDIISTKPVERILGAADWTAVFSWQLSLDGHRFYILTSKVSNFTLAYDLDENAWNQWTDSQGNYVPIVASTSDSLQRAIVQHESDGKLYYVLSTDASDAGEAIVADIITPNFDGGVQSRGKYLPRMYFIGDQMQGSELLIRKNDADYDPLKWSNWRRVDMSKRLPHLDNCGSFNRRAHWIRHQTNDRMRLEAIELQMELCTLAAQGG